MKNDIEIQKNVTEELKNIPLIHGNEIGVAVKNGIVTLSGIVDSYPKKIVIERSVKKVAGVKGIAEVHLSEEHKKSDSEIAQIVLHTLHWHSAAPIDKISIFIEDGVVTIEGIVDWDYQRKHVSKIAGNILGVKSLINNLKVVSSSPIPVDVKTKIQNAFARNALINAANIKIEVDEHKVALTGKVKNLQEYDEAERSVWNTPGITSIENGLEVEDDVV